MHLSSGLVLDKLLINRGSKKCFIFDLDGTIIFNNKYLSTENEILLKRIHDAGHELIFATGRPLKDFKPVMPVWTHNQPVTVFSGAVSVHNSEIISSHGIKRNLVEEVIEICIGHGYRFIMDTLLHHYHPDVEGMVFGILDHNSKQYRIKNLDMFLEKDVYKILIFDLHTMGFFSEYAKANDLLIKHHSYDNCFDIVSPQCNKYLGVLPFINKYAANDVFVFGNDFNDYELFTNFSNSILFGSINELQNVVKLDLPYNQALPSNFTTLIHTILDA